MTAPTHAMVLGASGFIGKRLSDHLSSKGWHVDRVISSPGACDTSIVADRGSGRTIQIGPSDDGIARAVRLSEPEVVFNLAASGVGKKVPYSRLVDGNVGIVARLLEGLDPRTTKTVVHAGSWSQYRIESPDDVAETVLMEPPTTYGAAKVGAELMGRSIAEEIGVGFVTLRLFNVYGRGENPSRLIPYVAGAVLGGTVAELTSGEQERDFVHVDDVVAAFEACAGLSPAQPTAFNVATGIATRVCDVAVMAAAATGGDVSLLRFGAKPPRLDEPMRVVGDASALARATGWAPRTTVAAGVNDTVAGILEAGAQDD